MRIRREKQNDGGSDFLVEIKNDDALGTQMFVVQVKGTTSADSQDWTRSVGHLFRTGGSPIHLPACVFVTNVRENKTFAWIAEPQISAKRATLRMHDAPHFRLLDSAGVSELIDQVKAWYEVLPKQLAPA